MASRGGQGMDMQAAQRSQPRPEASPGAASTGRPGGDDPGPEPYRDLTGVNEDGKELLQAMDAASEEQVLIILTRPGFNGANVRGDDGCTALHRAAERGLASICRALLGRTAGFSEANGKDSDSCTALHYASLNGHATCCRAILQHAGFAEADAKDCTGCTALHHAALSGHAEVCQVLLDSPRYADVNTRDCTGCTALHQAADNGHAEACRVMVEHPRFTKVSIKDREGRTALHSAAMNGHAEACRALLEHPEVLAWGAARDRKGHTAHDLSHGAAREVLDAVGALAGDLSKVPNIASQTQGGTATTCAEYGTPFEPKVLFEVVTWGEKIMLLL